MMTVMFFYQGLTSISLIYTRSINVDKHIKYAFITTINANINTFINMQNILLLERYLKKKIAFGCEKPLSNVWE